MNQPPLINGVEYSWADITLNLLGVPVAGITAISYKKSKVKENVYGAGSKPVSRGYGNETYEGSITFLMTELQALRKAAPDGDITKIPPFAIPVAFLPENSVNVVLHTLRNVEFMEDSVSSKQGDTKIEVEIPLIISDVKFK
jgi:alanine racemase